MTDENNPPDEPSHPPTRARKRPRPSGQSRRRNVTTGQFVTKMTEAVIDKIVTAIGDQSAPETACALAGVNVRTFRQWLADGREWLDAPGRTLDEIPTPEAVVVIRVEQAMAKARDTLERRVANNEDWKAADRILSVRYPREFAKRERLDIGNPDGESFRIAGRDLSMLDRAELVALRAILLKINQSEQGGQVIDLPARRRELGAG